MRAILFLLLALLVPLTLPGALRADCAVRDFRALPLPAGADPLGAALELAYPGGRLDRAAGTYITPDGQAVPFAPARAVGGAARLTDATIGDQFAYPYPLAFDLDARRTPFMDPGRPRNEALFRALWFDTEAAARASLTTVGFAGQSRTTRFQVTQRHCVHTQLQAVFAVLQPLSPGIDIYFDNSGGSFNWRVIAGTDRLSSHSFGAAIDLNTELGGYWRWSGASEGQVPDYDNRMPPELVAAFERYGFIWGGKWHHFDGMHFEYRPELILFARLTER